MSPPFSEYGSTRSLSRAERDNEARTWGFAGRNKEKSVVPVRAAAVGFAAASEVCHDGDDQMGDEPDIFVAHVLIDIDQDEHSRENDAEQDVGPLRNAVRREEVRIHRQIDEHHDPREEQRK